MECTDTIDVTVKTLERRALTSIFLCEYTTCMCEKEENDCPLTNAPRHRDHYMLEVSREACEAAAALKLQQDCLGGAQWRGDVSCGGCHQRCILREHCRVAPTIDDSQHRPSNVGADATVDDGVHSAQPLNPPPAATHGTSRAAACLLLIRTHLIYAPLQLICSSSANRLYDCRSKLSGTAISGYLLARDDGS